MIFHSRVHAPVTLEPITFADIVINLFVFFFLSFGIFATFDGTHKGLLPVKLPTGGDASSRVHSKPVTITVNRSGSAFLARKAIPLHKLTEAVNQELAKMKVKHLVLRPDRALTLNHFVTILDRLRKSHAEAISIETQLPNQ